MPHGDGYQFIQLGKHLERAGEKSARILDVKYAALGLLEEGSAGSPDAELIAMLRSCSALEAYRKHAKVLQTWRVVDYLLLNDIFFHAQCGSVWTVA